MLFDKPLNAIDPADIDELVRREVGESDMVEFKSDLTTKGNDKSNWHGGKALGPFARDEFLEEIVAFANSLGGTLVIGIEETSESPPRAAKVNAIPRCADLGLRLEQQAGACIEPQIPNLRILGIPTDAQGRGVVVAFVGRSNLAPHRLASTRECYTRRGERTERMTMREIRDLVLTTRDLSEFIERRFSVARAAFTTFMERPAFQSNCFGFSVALVPLDPDRIRIDALHNIDRPERFWRAVRRHDDHTQQVEFPLLLPRPQWRPCLRGLAFEHDGFEVEFFDDGDVRLRLCTELDTRGHRQWMDPEALVASIANGFAFANTARNAASEAQLEFGLEAELVVRSTSTASIANWRGGIPIRGSRLALPARFSFPRYRVGQDASELLQLFVRDMWNAVGVDSGDAVGAWDVVY